MFLSMGGSGYLGFRFGLKKGGDPLLTEDGPLAYTQNKPTKKQVTPNALIIEDGPKDAGTKSH